MITILEINFTGHVYSFECDRKTAKSGDIPSLMPRALSPEPQQSDPSLRRFFEDDWFRRPVLFDFEWSSSSAASSDRAEWRERTYLKRFFPYNNKHDSSFRLSSNFVGAHRFGCCVGIGRCFRKDWNSVFCDPFIETAIDCSAGSKTRI